MAPGARLQLPRLYAILDLARVTPDAHSLEERLAATTTFGGELAAGGATLIQFRGKQVSASELLAHARALRRVLPPEIKLILNDRADLCVAAGFDGVHLGQEDLSPQAARAIIGPARILGVSTHNAEELRRAAESSADYLAIGPVFATASKESPDPVVGLEGVRAARAALGEGRALVAIGGIGRAQAAVVLRAGADAVAVISALLQAPRQSAAYFQQIML